LEMLSPPPPLMQEEKEEEEEEEGPRKEHIQTKSVLNLPR